MPLLMMFVLCAGFLGHGATVAQAQVSVDRVILNFLPRKAPVTNLTVRNSSGAVLYVKTEAYAVQSPGFPTEKLEATDRLLISPKRFSVPAKGQRTVRLLLRDPPGDVEKTYRASFLPVESEAGFEQEVKIDEKRKAVLRVLTGMGILVFVHPVKSQPNLTWERADQRVRITNTGNVNVFVDQLKICFTNVSCRDLPPKRFYPGNFQQFDTMPRATISFRKFVNEEYTNVVIPPDGAAIETKAPSGEAQSQSTEDAQPPEDVQVETPEGKVAEVPGPAANSQAAGAAAGESISNEAEPTDPPKETPPAE